MWAYVGPASNVRVECTPRACFGEAGALAELLSFFEKSEVNSPTIENNRQMIEISEADNSHHMIDNKRHGIDNNLHGIDVPLAFVTVPNGA